MRSATLVVFGLALAAPAAEACSLAYQPYDQPSFHDDGLWFVDGAALLHVDGLVETRVVEAYFLGYARLADDGLLVAGQDGLGADCSGDPWLELREGDTVRWRQEKGARVFAHPLGPFVQKDRELFRLEDGELARVGTLPDNDYIVGWTTGGTPVARDSGSIHFDGRRLALPSGDEPAVSEHDGLLGVVEVLWDNQLERSTSVALHVVHGDQVSNVTWELPPEQDAWGDGLAWAKGWLAAAGGRAYLVTDKVTDLGVAGARAVASRGEQGVVFTDQGYVVFDGTEPVEAWERDRQTRLWRPVSPTMQGGGDVEAEFEGPGPWLQQERRDEAALTVSGGDEGPFTVPGAGPLVVALAALALAAIRRR